MSTMEPIGDGGGGPTSTTSADENMTSDNPSTGIAVSPGSHHQQHPPPSPLSGCYLLVVLPEPHTAQHTNLILNRLAEGFLSWDKDNCHVDLEKELQALVAQAPEGEEARNGERLIQYATENLVTEVLIHPQTNTLLQCVRNLLASFTKHRHIIHAGYTFGGNGSWILQDGTFSLADFLDAFSEHEVQRVLRAYGNSVTVDINCAEVGEWSTSRLSKEACTRSCRVRLNPHDVLTAGIPAIASFTSYVGQYLIAQTLDQLMEPSDVVGNIRFSHPTLYVFPGGQGDAALFGINGFNMLVDGGFARKACFWDFARHLDRLDAVLLTRINNSNVGGMASVLCKKREMHVYPQIGHFFCNLIERRLLNSPDGDKDLDPLILNLTDIGQEMMVDLRKINLRAHPCYRDPNPINLYHKVGHGTLDMYVLSPSKDSREVREFLTKWHAADSKLFAGSYRKDSNNLTFPIQNLASICALLVWQPANPDDTITRILFPGSTPQHKIFEGIERLKHLEFLKHPVCTAKSLSPSTSLLVLKDRSLLKQKLGLIEETKKFSDTKKDKRDMPESKLLKGTEDFGPKPTSQAVPVIPISKMQSAKIDGKTKKVHENKKIETESKNMEKDLKELKKEFAKKDLSKAEKDSESKKLEGYRAKVEDEKIPHTREYKVKSDLKRKEMKESKPVKMNQIDSLLKSSGKSLDKKTKSPMDRKDSAKASPPTPKKAMNGSGTKMDLVKASPRLISKHPWKQSLSMMPAKSAKDANNRKVVEQKNVEIASAVGAAIPAVTKLLAKQKVSERKPIGRRIKPLSPSKVRTPISPTKSMRSTPTTSVKSDKDGVSRKIKGDRGTTDSSPVSTPSGIEIDSMTKLADKSITEKSEDMSLDSIESKVLADLKEEREVVEEIEAVLQKAERIEGVRRDDLLDGDDDITAEAIDKKEDDMTEDDVTADIEEMQKKESSRKTSHELTEDDEYLIIEKEEIYIEDSIQSGEGEHKHLLDGVESEMIKTIKDGDIPKKEEVEEQEEKEIEEPEMSEEHEKADTPEKQLGLERNFKETEPDEISPGHKELLEEEVKEIITSAAEIVHKTDDKDDSGKKDSEDITKEPSSLSPDKFDSSEKKTTDTDIKIGADQKDQQIPEKLEESHERISTLESGATTTAPTLPEDERIPLDEIKEVIDEKFSGDQAQKKISVIQVKEPSAGQISVEPKLDAKPFEVRPPLRGMQREIVKTPDEVADLPVHEEVDPTLYQMDDFGKSKDEKPSQGTAQQQETKEPGTPPIKEQKGVFSFFGKVADKFEKGIDKLTGKSRRDSEKDIDDKSSSKSGSPKETKSQNISFLGDIEVEDMSTVFPKVRQTPEVPELFEKGKPEINKIKLAAIKDTATFLQEEIEDFQKTTYSDDKPSTKEDTKTSELKEPPFETYGPADDKDKLESVITELVVEEDAEDVVALLVEASKKFKTVKDSLRDSLESLNEKIAEEEMVRVELEAVSNDVVKDTLSEVVGKLEDIKLRDGDESLDTQILENVTFDVPKVEYIENAFRENEAISTKDFKEAVRDVGEVLAGSAGILIEDQPKDIIDIVKKVAQVLKKDDFLSHDQLFNEDASKIADKVSDDDNKSERVHITESAVSKKEAIIEELPLSGAVEIHKDPCVKNINAEDTILQERDPAGDKIGAMNICADFKKDEPSLSRQKQSLYDDQVKSDVMEEGIEPICVKQNLQPEISISDVQGQDIDERDIVLKRKLTPGTVEVVIVTPDLSPTSSKILAHKMHTEEIQMPLEANDCSLQLEAKFEHELNNQIPLPELIDYIISEKGLKITREIFEYLTTIRKVPRETVIRIIEESIVSRGVPPDTVLEDLDLLRSVEVSTERRGEIEQFIHKEYITKNKSISMEIIEEISKVTFVIRRIIIEIIKEMMIKKNVPREKIFHPDISEKEFPQLLLPTEDAELIAPKISVSEGNKTQEIISAMVEKHSEIEQYIVSELIAKEKKVTPQLINDFCVRKQVPKRIFLQIIEKVMVQRSISRSSIFDISKYELSELFALEDKCVDIYKVASEPECKIDDIQDNGSIMADKKLEIVEYISDEFITTKRRITPQILKDVCVRKGVSRRIFIEIVEEIIIKRKLRRSSVFDISDKQLSELLSVDEEQIDEQSIASESDKKSPVIDSGKIEPTICERSEIESTIIDEFVSRERRITPYIFEDICIRYKVSRRIIIEIIEDIVAKRNIARNVILDIADNELSDILAVVKTEDEGDKTYAESITKDLIRDDEDKLVDGFVNIPFKVDTLIDNVHTVERVEDRLKESDTDVDDFEAVEQEYKIHGVSPTEIEHEGLKVQISISDEKNSDDLEEAIDENASNVIEAKENICTTVPLTVEVITAESKFENKVEDSEAIDTTEKYFIETEEQNKGEIYEQVQPSDKSSDNLKESHSSSDIEVGTLKDSKIHHDYLEDERKNLEVKELSGYSVLPDATDVEANLAKMKPKPMETSDAIEQTILLEVNAIVVAERKECGRIKLDKEQTGTYEELKTKSPITEGSIDILGEKRDGRDVKESSTFEVLDEVESTIESISPKYEESLNEVSVIDETELSSSTVRRMVITASSEDGGQEIEVCPTGSITFTPDDSLKSSPIKTTPEQDSVRFEKESLHSSASTPDKDNISDKSTPGTKDGEKITPEDSLDKSPIGTRDSQDLEDSLDKSDAAKLKEIEATKSLINVPEHAIPISMDYPAQIATPRSGEPILFKKSSVKSEIAKTVTDSSPEEQQISEAPKRLSIVEDDRSELVNKVLMSDTIDDRIYEKSRTLIISSEEDRVPDAQQSPPTLCTSDNDLFTKGVVVETSSSAVRTCSIMSKTDSKPSSIERETTFHTSEYLGIMAPKDTDKLIPKNELQIDEYDLKDVYALTTVKKTDDAKTLLESLQKSELPRQLDGMRDEKAPIAQAQLPSETAHIDYSQSISIADLTPREHVHVDDKPKSYIVAALEIDESGVDDLSVCTVEEDDKNILSVKGTGIGTIELISADNEERSKNISVDYSGSSSMIGEEDHVKHCIKHFETFIPSDVKDEMNNVSKSSECLTATDITTKKHDDEQSCDRSKSPSIIGEKPDEKIIGRSKSSSIAPEKQYKELSSDRSRSPSITLEIQDNKTSSERSQSPRITPEKVCDETAFNRSKFPSLVLEILDDTGSSEHPRAPSIAAKKQDGEIYSERSISPIATPEKQNNKMFSKHFRSPSIAPEKLDEQTLSDNTRSPIIDSEKQENEVLPEYSASSTTEIQDDKTNSAVSKSPSIAPKQQEDKLPSQRSEPSNITAAKQVDEIPFERSKSSSITSEMQDEQTAAKDSESPNIASQRQDDKAPSELSRSPSTSAERLSDKTPSERSMSPSIILDKQGDEISSERSGSSSISPGIQHEKTPVERSRSPSIPLEQRDEKAPSEHWQSLSIASQKQDDKAPSEHSRSPSITVQKQDGKTLPERSISPSIASEKHGDEIHSEPSRSPSIPLEKQVEKTASERSRSPSTPLEQDDEKALSEHSRSPSITVEKQDDKTISDRSISPRISPEKQDEKTPSERSRSPSIPLEQQDEKALFEHSRSPSITVEKQDDKTLSDRSISPSIASERQDEKNPSERSRSPSIPLEQQGEKALSEHSRSPSITVEKQDDKTLSDSSISPSVASEKQGDEIHSERSRSSSIPSEKLDGKAPSEHWQSPRIVSQQQDDKGPSEHSRSPTITVEKQDDKTLSERPISPRIASEQHGDEILSERSRSPSIPPEKQHEKTPSECSKLPRITLKKKDEKPAEHSRSPSKTTETQDEILSECSSSLSIALEIQDDNTPSEYSKIPSITAEDKVDNTPSERPISPRIASEQHGDEILSERSRSPSIPPEKQHEKTPSECSKLPRITLKKKDEKPAEHSRSPSKTTETQDEILSECSSSLSIALEIQDDNTPSEYSKIPSITAEDKVDNTPSERSITPTVTPKKAVEEIPSEPPRSLSIAPEKQGEKVPSGHSEFLSIACHKHDDLAPSEHSRSPSITAEKQADEMFSEDTRSPSIAPEKQHAEILSERLRSPSAASDKRDEGIHCEQSRSPSTTSQQQAEKDLSEQSWSPSLTGETQDEKTPSERSISPCTTTGKQDDGIISEHFKSPSILPEKQHAQILSESSRISSTGSQPHDEEDPTEQSWSPSLTAEKRDEKTPSERSISPSSATEKQDDGILSEHLKSHSIAPEKEHAEIPSERSRSPSSGSQQQDEKDLSEQSRSPSLTAEKRDEKTPSERSISPSTATEKQDDGILSEHLKSHSIAPEKEHAEIPSERSRSPSTGSQQQDEKELSEQSRSPSLTAEKRDEKTPSERSISPSTAKEKQDDGILSEHLKSHSIAPEKEHAEIPSERSRSPSTGSQQQDEKDLSEQSRSPSLTAEKRDEKTPSERSISPSTTPEKQEDGIFSKHLKSPSIVPEKQHVPIFSERSRASSTGSQPQDEKDHTEQSWSPNLGGNTQNEKTPSERSISPSTATEKQDDGILSKHLKSHSIAPEKEHAEIPSERSRSPSSGSQQQDEKDLSEQSRSPSLTAEKRDEKTPSERSISPSTTPEKQEDGIFSKHLKSPSIVPEKQHVPIFSERSRASSTGSQPQDEKDHTEQSWSPNLGGKTQNEKTPSERSISPSTATEKQDDGILSKHLKSHSIAPEKEHAEIPSERSRSPSSGSQQQDEKDLSEQSRSPSLTAEKRDEKTPFERSISPSTATEKQDDGILSEHLKSHSIAPEKEHAEIPSERSRSPSTGSQQQDEKHLSEQSRSPSLIAEKRDEKTPSERSISPSTTPEKQEDGIFSKHLKSPSIVPEKQHVPIFSERSRASSTGSQPQDEKDHTEQSWPPNLGGKTQNEKTPSERSISPSTATEKQDDGILSKHLKSHSIAPEKEHAEIPSERSRSPSSGSQQQDEKDLSEQSRSPSLTAEKRDEKTPSERSISPSTATEKQDDGILSEHLKSHSIAPEKEHAEIPSERSRSPSTGSQQQDEKHLSEQSRSPSLIAEKRDEKTPSKRSISPSTTPEKQEDGIFSKHLKSPSIVPEKQHVPIFSERSRASSTGSQPQDEKDHTEQSWPPNLGGKTQNEKTPSERSISPSTATEEQDDGILSKHLKSHSIAPEKEHAEIPSERSRSPSSGSQQQDEKDLSEQSSPSLTAEKRDEKTPSERSISPSTASEKQDDGILAEHLKSHSIAPEKEHAEIPSERSRSPSTSSQQQDEKELSEQSRSPSLTAEKRDEKTPSERSISPSTASEKQDDGILSEHLKSHSIAPEKEHAEIPSERSRSPSTGSQQQNEKDLSEQSRSPSLTAEKRDEKTPSERSISPSPALEKPDDEILSEHPRSPSITPDEQHTETLPVRLKSPSIVSQTQDVKDVSAHSISPITPAEKLDKTPSERSVSPSIALEIPDDKIPSEHSKRSSMASQIRDDTQSPEHSRSPSTVSLEQDEKISSEQLKSPSLAAEKLVDKIACEHSRSPIIASKQQDDKIPSEQSKSSSFTGEKQNEETPSERSKSPSIAPEKQDDEIPCEHSKSPSTSPETPNDETHTKRPKLFSSPLENEDGNTPSDRIRSPSIDFEKQGDKTLPAHSRSPSITCGTQEDQTLAEFSKSSNISPEKQRVEDRSGHWKLPSTALGAHGDKTSAQLLKSPTVVSENQNDNTPSQYSSPFSVTSEKSEEPVAIERSISLGVSSEVQNETHPADHTILFDHLRSSTVSAEMQDEKETVDQPRSPSIVAQKGNEREPDNISRSASITSEKLDETALLDYSRELISDQKDKTKPVDYSRSPSIAAEKQDNIDSAHCSRLSSIAAEKQDETQLIEYFRSPSIFMKKVEETEPIVHLSSASVAAEKQDKMERISPSFSPNVLVEKLFEKEQIDRSKSLNTIAVKQNEIKPVNYSKSFSIAAEMQKEEEIPVISTSTSIAVEKVDRKERITYFVSPSTVAQKADLTESIHDSRHPIAADEQEKIERPSLSPRVLSKDQCEKQQVDHSSLLNIAAEKQDEQISYEDPLLSSIATAEPNGEEPHDHSLSSVTAAEIQTEIETHDRLISSGIDTDKMDEKDPRHHTKLPDSTSLDTTTPIEKIQSDSTPSEKRDDSEDQSKSPSVQSEVTMMEQDSRRPTQEDLSKTGDQISDDTLRLSGLPDDNHERAPFDSSKLHKKYSLLDDLSEKDDGKSLNHFSVSSSIGEEKYTQQKPEKLAEKLRLRSTIGEESDAVLSDLAKSPNKASSSIASMKHEEQILLDPSRSSSIVEDNLIGKDVLPCEHTSQSIADKKNDEHEPIDLSKSAIVDTQERDPESCHIRKAEISKVLTTHGGQSDEHYISEALQKLAETRTETSVETKLGGNMPPEEISHHDTPKDRSRSHSLFDVDEKTLLGRSRTASLFEDKVPEVVSFLGDAKTGPQNTGISMPMSIAIEEDIADNLSEVHTTAHRKMSFEECIINRYITNKEKITPQIVDDIATLYSMPRDIILQFIETIIVKRNVSRESIINIPKGDEMHVPIGALSDDSIGVNDISTAKRQDIENYILEEVDRKNRKISSKTLDEIATLKSVPRKIIIVIIKEMVTERNVLEPGIIEDGILDESKIEVVQSAAKDSEYIELKAITSQQSPIFPGSNLEDHLPSISTDFKLVNETDSIISEQKRIEIEIYIMEECVKKGRKITDLVLEQIIARMGVSKSSLLDIIENIIVTRKMSRKGMVDDAIYDTVAIEMRKSPEYIVTKAHLFELSGEYTQDLKSSGYSTPEARQYDDKCNKEISSYSADYESPFHKAFVGGMTEIRTTHITTLSGKSTPDYSMRDEAPASLSESMKSSSKTTFEENFINDEVTPIDKPGHESPQAKEQDPSTLCAQVTMVTTATTVAGALDSPCCYTRTSVQSDSNTRRETFPENLGTVALQDIGRSRVEHNSDEISGTTKIISTEVYEEEKSKSPTRIIGTKIMREDKPVIERRVIRKESVEESPEVITKIIRRSIIDQDYDTSNDYELHTLETVATKTTKTLVTDRESAEITKDYASVGPVRTDIKRTVTAVTSSTTSGFEMSTDKSVQETAIKLEDSRALKNGVDCYCIKTEDIDEGAIPKTFESVEMEKMTVETLNKMIPASESETFEFETDSEPLISHSGSCHEKIECLRKIQPEKLEHPMSPIIKDLILDQRTFSGKISTDKSLPKDVQAVSSVGISTPEISISPLMRESATGHPQRSGRSTPDKRPTSRSSTATPEGLRSNEVIRTTITTIRTMSEEGDIITTTMEITETTNEQGETIILAEKTDVKVEDRILPADIGEGTLDSGFESTKVLADLSSETDVDPVSPPSDHSSVHSRAGTHVWGSEERHAYSDEEVTGSPLSTTSQVGYSPQATYHFSEHSFGKLSSHKSVEFSETDMSSSFYGELPELPPRATTIQTPYMKSSSTRAVGISSSSPTDSDFSFKKFVAKQEYADVSTCEKSTSKIYIDEADLDVEKGLIECKEMSTDMEATCVASTGRPSGSESSSLSMDKDKEPQGVTKKDPLATWGTPLGLPSPKPPRKFNLRTITRSNNSTDISPGSTDFDAFNDWGEPLRLPSPAAITDEASNKGAPSTPKKERRQPRKVTSENIKNKKRSESPIKTEKKSKELKNKIQPIYMDLTYVPHHGNSYYSSIDFFKRVRARYYVFSGTEPSREVYDALLDAKKTWEDKDLEVTMIPTYDTDTLGYWVADNEEALAANHIDLSPSASRCTINLQDHETSCSAYRLEF